MTHRDRWLRTFRYQTIDHVPDEEFGYWDETYTTWHQQGLPTNITNEWEANQFFGFAPRHYLPMNLGLMPWFDYTIVEETERHRIVRDGIGVLSVVNLDGTSTIPHYLEFPVKDRESWLRFCERLDPQTDGRFPSQAQWQEIARSHAERDYPLGVSVGSLFGWIRDWMGFEGVSVACVEQPDLIEEIMEHITLLALEGIRRIPTGVRLDFASMWEDMCFNKGSIISPRMFSRWMVPRYKRIADALKPFGCEIVYVDCDGNIGELIPLWLDGGVNCMFPLEVRAGTDPLEIRSRWGKSVLLMGGVDKMRLIEGKDAIVAEIRRLEPLVAEGGFIPHVDHRCPPDVTYENYLFYLRAKREAFGIPHSPPA